MAHLKSHQDEVYDRRQAGQLLDGAEGAAVDFLFCGRRAVLDLAQLGEPPVGHQQLING